MPTEEMSWQATKIVFCTEDGAMKFGFPASVAVYAARTATLLKIVYELEELYEAGMQSFQEFSREIMSLSDQVRFALRTEEECHFKDCLKINRSLSSLFTVLRMYSDFTKKLFKDSNERVRRLFSMPGYWELDSLRNYVQHVSFLPFKRSLQCDLCDPDTAFAALRCELDAPKFNLNELENPRTRENLEKLLSREHIDLYELVMDGMAAFRHIHQIVRRTSCFTTDYEISSRYLKRLHETISGNGLSSYKLLKGDSLIEEGKSYFCAVMIALVEEIRVEFPSHTIYPADKIYPTVAPKDFLLRYQAAYPMKSWYKQSAARLEEEEKLLRDFDLGDVKVPVDLQGIDEVQVLLDGFSTRICISQK